MITVAAVRQAVEATYRREIEIREQLASIRAELDSIPRREHQRRRHRRLLLDALQRELEGLPVVREAAWQRLATSYGEVRRGVA